MFIHHQIFDSSINLGEIISVVVLAITAGFICWQAWETRKSAKYLEYQTRPAAYPLLLWGSYYDEKDQKEKQKTFLYIKNDSKLKILFNFRVSLKIDNTCVQDFRPKPLHVFPGGMIYPSAMSNLDRHLEKNAGEEIFEIEYEMALVNNPDLKFRDYLPDEWRFTDNHWVGPDGISPEGVKSVMDRSLKVDIVKMPPKNKK